ncbi:MAG TPA: beta-galactosidase trimerization domain-containing protein, partial [Gemmataceae bacterium]|nr:beta-galactosidase trimerization domain-containing protein [Gemmataceae bacterium]
ANGKQVGAGETTGDAHTASAMAMARSLIAHHFPFGIITKKSLPRPADHKVLVLPNVCLMDEEETKSIREWVRSGGCLLATGWTSLANRSGQLQKDFMLADVLGVSLKQPSWKAWEHYVAPTPAGKAYFGHFSAKYPAFARTIGVHVEAHREAQILATTTLPWPTNDTTKFSSIHSNPPWQATNRPEIVFNRYGKGRTIYCSSPIETVEVLAGTFVQLVRLLHDRFAFEVDAPSCVEATLFHQPDRNRYLLNFVNFQKDLPNLPVDGIAVRLRLPKGKVKAVNRLPDAVSLPFREIDGVVSFNLHRLQTFLMVEVQTA